MRSYWRNLWFVLVLAAPLLAAAQADSGSVLVAEGDRFLAGGHFSDAIRAYTAALGAGADFSRDPLHARNLGRCYLSELKPDYGQAARWLQQSLAIEPGDDALFLLARAQAGMGAWDAAAGNYRALSLAHPHDPDYILGWTRALRQAGKPDAALDALRAALERAPALNSVRVEYGRLLSFQRRLPEARRQFEQVLASDPDNLAAQVGLAKVTSWQGDQETALRLYERILQRNPGLYDGIVGKAFSLLWTGRTELARPLLLQAARRHPDDEDVREALASLGVAVPMPPARQTMEETPPPPEPPRTLAKAAPRFNPPPKPLREKSAPRSAARPAVQPAPSPSAAPRRENRKESLYQYTAGILTVMLLLLAGVILLWQMRSDSAGRPPATPSALRISYYPIPPSPRAAESPPRQTPSPAPEVSEATATLPPPPVGSAATVAADPPKSGPPAAPDVFLHGARVVLIGSNHAVLQFESRVLANSGAETATFDSWLAALASFDAAEPDLLVLNPLTADGWTALTMFAWLSANREELLPRTVVTLSVRDDESEEFCRLHIGSFLHHPFRAHELLAAVTARLQPASAPPLAPPSPPPLATSAGA